MRAAAQGKMKGAAILVVDDIDLNRKMLVHSLLAAGYTNISEAHDGEQALSMTAKSTPDLVILDLMMPGMDGFAYCQAVRQERAFDTMPIIVQTVLDQMDNKIRAFKLGASDYICKPIDPGELVARVHVHLSNKLLTQELLEYHERIVGEFDSARKMQQRIMPSNSQIQIYERVYDMKIAQHFETSSHIGGDSWGIRPLNDNRLAIWMYDFSGHGVSAAMNVFRLHTVMQEFVQNGGDPGNFLTMLNRHLYPLLERSEFCTMFYGVIDTESNCLLYSSAAALPACIASNLASEPVALLEAGFPLGSVAGAVYETRYAPFIPGDLLLFYSDCLTETQNADGKYISEQQILGVMNKATHSAQKNPASYTVDTLVKLLRAHNSQPIGDDLTINAYWRCPTD